MHSNRLQFVFDIGVPIIDSFLTDELTALGADILVSMGNIKVLIVCNLACSITIPGKPEQSLSGRVWV